MSLNFFIITHGIIGLMSLTLGLVIFYKNVKNKINITFGLLSLSIAVWAIFYSVWLLSVTPEKALFYARALNAASIFIPVFYLHWVVCLLNLKRNKILVFYYLLSIFFLFFSFNVNFISRTAEILNFPFFPQANWLYILWLVVVWGFVIFYSMFLLITELRSATGNYKSQLLYVFWASIIGFIGGSTNHLLMFGISLFPPIGSPMVVIYPVIFSYVIVKHRLMDIKMVMRRYSVFLASLSLVLILATAVKYFFEIFFYDYSIWADPIILLASLLIFPSIRNYFYRLANEYFFSSLYDSGEVIAALSEKLRSTLEVDRIYEYIFDTLAHAFHIKAFGVLTHNEESNIYIIQYNQGFKVGVQTAFLEDENLGKMFIKQNKIIVTEEARRLGIFEKNQTIDLLSKMKVEILAPLNVKDKTIGLIALGAKESGDMYNDEDLKVLGVIGAQTAIALENALLYKETKNFNIKLEKEVEEATKDLRRANAQLKKLDAAKSEFISIASHQLRTPLTVIKGYISMMLEGNFGVLTKPESESLEKVFESNERLIQLVEDLLNISRIESGRLQFNFKKTDLNKTIESVVDELSGNAKKKNLILEYKAPAKPLSLLKLDDEKIRQVVMNLIDNGIKYTKQGSVAIRLEQKANKVVFCVSDSGMGIRPEDMVNLFKKFSRGTGTSLIHTEGTGLGLYVARMMVEAHKGRIWAESDGVGKGSKFCFELPIK